MRACVQLLPVFVARKRSKSRVSSRSLAQASLPSCSHDGWVSFRTEEMIIVRDLPADVIVQISKRGPPFARRAKAIVPSDFRDASVLRSSVDVRRVLLPPVAVIDQMSS